MRFQDSTVLVTGGGSGIGRAIAWAFAGEGADVAIHDISPEGAAQTAEMVRARGRRAETYTVDVSRAGQVRQAIAATLRDFDRVHILVNCAGVTLYRHPFDFSDEEWDRIIGVDLTGTWNYCRYLGPHLVERGGGSIVNVSSINALYASYYRAPYTAAKAGVLGLTRALALDLAEARVRVNAVGPGPIKTGMTRPDERREGSLTDEVVEMLVPMRRWGTVEEIAGTVLFLASEDASFVTGQMLVADGGLLAGGQFGQNVKRVRDADG